MNPPMSVFLRWSRPWLLPVALLACWEMVTTFAWVPSSLLAPPDQVLRSLFSLASNGQLLVHVSASLYRLLVGFFLGSLLGAALGIFTGVSKRAEAFLSPTFQAFAPVPPIAWIPLLIVFFGIGEGSKIALIALASFVVVYLHAFQGVRAADQKLVELAHAYKKGRPALVWEVLLPCALPGILTGLRVSLGLSWILLIAAELIASSRGLGWLIWDSRNFSRPDDMLAGMLAIAVLGGLSDRLLALLEKRLLSWRDSFAGA